MSGVRYCLVCHRSFEACQCPEGAAYIRYWMNGYVAGALILLVLIVLAALGDGG